jgi:hypothetical protein
MRFEMTFEGKLDGSKIIGEFKNQMGSQEVTGRKMNTMQ